MKKSHSALFFVLVVSLVLVLSACEPEAPAQKDPQPYTLTLRFNNGDEDEVRTVLEGEVTVLPDVSFSGDEVFAGWFYYLGGSVPKEFTMPSNDCLLMAVKMSDPERFFKYDPNSKSVTGFNETRSSISIPLSFWGNEVVAVGDEAYKGNGYVTSVSIPEGIESIGAYALTGLNSVVMPSSIRSIGAYAFRGSRFSSISIPEGVTRLEEGTFYDCFDLQTIHLPSTLRSIGKSAFSYCIGLYTIDIPEGVKTIEQSAFGATRLNSVTMHDGLETIEYCAFYNDKYLRTAILPESLTTIGEYAFGNCSLLTEVSLYGDLTSIGAKAFESCSALATITYSGTRAQWNAIQKGDGWHNGIAATVVNCSDGDVIL